MKKKLKLAFEELERELALVSDVELVQVVGGFSSGNNAGLINHSFEESVDFLTDPGTGTNIESEQDLFYGSKIALNETTFNAYLNNYTTSSSSSSGSSGGYGSTGLSSTGYYLDEVIINSTGSTSTGHGYDHFSSGNQNGSGYNYSTGNGSTGSGSAGGDWGPGSGSPTIPVYTDIPNDPWKRDVNGKLIATKTNKSSNLPHGDVTLIFDEYKLIMENGSEVFVYKTTLVYDRILNITRLPYESEKANCFGLAFADGDYWFWDDTLTTAKDEFSGFMDMRNTYYQECSKEEATYAIIYSDNNFNSPIHTGKVNSDGSFTAKSGVGEKNTYYSEANFRAPEGNTGPQYHGTIKYYKYK